MPTQEKPVPLAHLSPVWPPPRQPNPWEVGRHWIWLGGLAILAFFWFLVPAFFRWPHTISSWGGRWFIHRTVIPVPALQQNDPRWADLLLGPSIDTIGQSGCAITSACMVLRAYGVDTDPQRMNAYLDAQGGYVGDGWLVWEKAAEVAPGGQVVKAYEDAPSYALIDQQILRGNPVIVRVQLRNGTTHFVVIVGKDGWSYLIRDPARPANYGVYPLRRLVSHIDALRFYTIVPPREPAREASPAPVMAPTPAEVIPASGTNAASVVIPAPAQIPAALSPASAATSSAPTNGAPAAPTTQPIIPANAYPALEGGTNRPASATAPAKPKKKHPKTP